MPGARALSPTGLDRAVVATYYTQDDWSRVLDALEAYESALARIGDDVRRRNLLPPYREDVNAIRPWIEEKG